MDRALNREFAWRAAPKREELLWLGTLHGGNGRSQIAMLIKRTWSTGKLEYVLKIEDAMGIAMFDPDAPHEACSTGSASPALPSMLQFVQQTELEGSSRLRIEYLPPSSGSPQPAVQRGPVIVKARFHGQAKAATKDRSAGRDSLALGS